MSRTFSTNCGSLESLKVSLRCGANEKAFQMRSTVEMDTPDVLAIERVLQCVAAAGIVSSVFVTTSAIFSSPILRGAPQRGSSSRPSKRFLTNRFRHSPAVSRERPSVAAIAQLFMPSAANSTISARTASPRAIFRRRARISNSLRSLSPRMIFTAGPRAISTSESIRIKKTGEGITIQCYDQEFLRRDTRSRYSVVI